MPTVSRDDTAADTATERSRAVVLDYIEALDAGDTERLRAKFTPDATWRLSGDLPVSGTWTGPGEIIDVFLAAMLERIDPSRPIVREVKRILADADAVAVEWVVRATARDGAAYENEYAFVFEVQGELIRAVREYFDTATAGRVLFSEPGAPFAPS
jgi:ketosteroid isomerase-like protein